MLVGISMEINFTATVILITLPETKSVRSPYSDISNVGTLGFFGIHYVLPALCALQ